MTLILVPLFGVHPTTAVGTDLLFAAATKTVGTLVHSAHHTVNWGVVGRASQGRDFPRAWRDAAADRRRPDLQAPVPGLG